GGAHVHRGAFARGHALARQGNDYWNDSGGRICNAMFQSWIVLGLAGLGRTDEALALNARTIAHCRDTGDRFMEPECVRLRGELTLAAQPSDTATAERLLREALAIAEAQEALSWELRAATSLARLLQSRDRRAEAAACLAPVLERFTEGRETPDLRQAGELLAELA
ncbi:MAG TPA: hypothetical protein VMM59_05300, partial [Thermohalobaculum sp.]|nr:hypothetical protein [Thermohalobaculum sp.]